MTEKEATDEGYAVKIGRFPYAANGKALGLRETDGFVKTVSDADSGDIPWRSYRRRTGFDAYS